LAAADSRTVSRGCWDRSAARKVGRGKVASGCSRSSTSCCFFLFWGAEGSTDSTDGEGAGGGGGGEGPQPPPTPFFFLFPGF